MKWLEAEAAAALDRGDYKTLLRHRRSIRMVLIGFWRGFRGDELARLTVENTCSGLLTPDTHLGENARHREVSDDQATPYLYP